jgi:hypothetical protein
MERNEIGGLQQSSLYFSFFVKQMKFHLFGLDVNK